MGRFGSGMFYDLYKYILKLKIECYVTLDSYFLSDSNYCCRIWFWWSGCRCSRHCKSSILYFPGTLYPEPHFRQKGCIRWLIILFVARLHLILLSRATNFIHWLNFDRNHHCCVVNALPKLRSYRILSKMATIHCW
jgi:hypothetical protein